MTETENQEPQTMETQSLGDRATPLVCIMIVTACASWAFWAHNKIGLGVSLVAIPVVVWQSLKVTWARGAMYAYGDCQKKITDARDELGELAPEFEALNDAFLKVMGPS
jgi:HAMP domain-containing protein